ncbi:dihydrodipicolinate synthase family protein [Halosimplex aquaticum]
MDLSEREEVVAVKFGVADVKEFAQTVQDADGELTWVNGIAERYALAFAVEGASGYTTGLGNFLPRTTLALYEAIENGHWERARTIQRSLRPLEDLRDSPGEGSTVAGGTTSRSSSTGWTWPGSGAAPFANHWSIWIRAAANAPNGITTGSRARSGTQREGPKPRPWRLGGPRPRSTLRTCRRTGLVEPKATPNSRP